MNIRLSSTEQRSALDNWWKFVWQLPLLSRNKYQEESEFEMNEGTLGESVYCVTDFLFYGMWWLSDDPRSYWKANKPPETLRLERRLWGLLDLPLGYPTNKKAQWRTQWMLHTSCKLLTSKESRWGVEIKRMSQGFAVSRISFRW